MVGKRPHLNAKSTWEAGLLTACAILLTLTGCAAAVRAEPPAATTATSTSGSPPALSLTPGTGAQASGTPAPTATGPAPTITSGSQVSVIAGTFKQPDDLVVGPDGSLYVSDLGDGTVKRVAPGGRTTGLVSGLSAPEGMVLLPDGSLIIAEQGRDRLVRYDPASHQTSLFLALANDTGQPGVDGITLDNHVPGQPSLIVPDSPNGTVLRVSLDGRMAQTIGSGFVRPVGAWAEPDGSILVADEFGDRIDRLAPDGGIKTLASVGEPDDVLEDASGHIYVTSLSDGAIYEIDARTGAKSLVVGRLLLPQGLAFDGHGGLYVSDPGHQQVVHIPAP